jgi:Cu(I)/Ag(I) efflux system membrane fusion protein
MKTKMLFGLVIGMVLGAGIALFVRGHSVKTTGQLLVQAETDYYTCPMHPSVRSDRPGACPVCGMALVKKSSVQAATQEQSENLRGISLSPTQRVLANVSTASVERRSLRKEISAVGVVDYAEPNYLHISMRFPGRLEKLHLNYTGQRVRKGDPVADVYSPEAISAQQEFLIALDWQKSATLATQAVAMDGHDLLEHARRKLSLWGFTDEQIERLRETRSVSYLVTMHSPISGTVVKKNVDPQHYAMTGEDIFDIADLSIVWVYLDIYERDLRFVKVGQTVAVTTESYPNEVFRGRVAFIDPVVNAETRTVRVRAEFTNTGGRLKPNMYVQASIGIPTMKTMVVPAAAVLSTGKRSVVWVEVQPGVFEPRDVQVGSSTEAFTEIVSGLKEGEHVAESGGFLIDSESALQQPALAVPHAEHGTHETSGADPIAKPSVYGYSERKGIREVRVLVKGKYTPDVIRVKQGVPVRLLFYRDEDADCTNEVVFEGLNIRRKLPARETTTIELTPKDTGTIGFSCGMGMIRGKLVVEE